jgi:hypothetical protein
MIEFLIDIIFIVFGDMMLQHTIYNRKYNWNKQNYSPLLTVYNNRVLSSSMTYQQILARVTQHDCSNSGKWTSYQTGTIELILVFCGVCIAKSPVFCEVFMLDHYQLLPKTMTIIWVELEKMKTDTRVFKSNAWGCYT